MATTFSELETLAGQWVAEDDEGVPIAHAHTLVQLEEDLIGKFEFSEDNLPAIRRVPEDGATSFIL